MASVFRSFCAEVSQLSIVLLSDGKGRELCIQPYATCHSFHCRRHRNQGPKTTVFWTVWKRSKQNKRWVWLKKVLLLSNTATLGTNYGYNVVQYMLKMIKPMSTQIHKKVKKSLFFLPNIALSWLFGGRYLRELFSNYNLARGRAIHTMFDDHDLISRSQVCQNQTTNCF